MTAIVQENLRSYIAKAAHMVLRRAEKAKISGDYAAAKALVEVAYELFDESYGTPPEADGLRG